MKGVVTHTEAYMLLHALSQEDRERLATQVTCGYYALELRTGLSHEGLLAMTGIVAALIAGCPARVTTPHSGVLRVRFFPRPEEVATESETGE
jgi:hypothetical protein